jgi:pimeloyl-ACP methyl ester carboxylesterase
LEFYRVIDSDPVSRRADPAPVVLLVHGAFADNSLWSGVIAVLHAAGIEASAVGISLRGLAADARYLSNAVRQCDRPVLLVGHAYGGAVMSNISGVDNVVGLVFIAGLAPDEGESGADLIGRFPETRLGPALFPLSYPNGYDSEAIELFLARAQFPAVFGDDLAQEDARTMAALQRPMSLAALEEQSGPPAWRELPSWYLITGNDQLLHPDAQRFFAGRAGSETVEIAASHAAPVSRASDVASLILRALQQVSGAR